MKAKKHRTFSIKWNIFSSLLVFIFIIIVILYLFQVAFLENFYRLIKSRSIKEVANEVNEVMNKASSKKVLDEMAKNKQFCVIVYDEKGSQTYRNEGDPRCRIKESLYKNQKKMIEKLSKKANKQGKASSLIEDIKWDLSNDTHIKISPDINFEPIEEQPLAIKKAEKKGMQDMTYISVIKNKEKKLQTIIISAQLSPVDATIETIQAQFLIIVLILILVAIILVFVLSRIIAKPIISINQSAKILAKGNYEVRFHAKGYLEIQELNDTLNYAAKELSTVEGLRKEVIANMSHDLRTPLTLINGYSEMMRDIPQENTPENAQIIIDETQRLTNLVNDMLDLSKLQAQSEPLKLARVAITKEIIAISQRYEKLVKGAVNFQFMYDQQIDIEADVIKIHQVFYNLINNAINYCGDDKQVIIRQTILHNKVRFEVIDHGKGIDPKQRTHIWERYYKINKNHVRSQRGSGLGLSIVKEILELHQATYGVQSEVNKGSNFYFEIAILPDKKED